MKHCKRASTTMASRIVSSLTPNPSAVLGIDVGDRVSRFCMLDMVTGEQLRTGRLATTAVSLERLLSRKDRMRVAIEVGTHSGWMSDRIAKLGHDVLVANSRELRLIYRSDRKNDELDAEKLARLARVDPRMLYPIQHRSLQTQADLMVLRARVELIRSRTQLINSVRGTVKAFGERLPSCSAERFHKLAALSLPGFLEPALTPLVGQIEELTARIREYDKRIEAMTERYPVVQKLRAVPGVGPITAVCFVLVLDELKRFKSARSVGAYLGLCPGLDESGDTSLQLSITKAGDVILRALLVNCAHYILGPFGPDCDLRRHGLKLAQRGGHNAKMRAVVAVARKLAVVLFVLATKDVPYEPLRQASRSEAGLAPQTQPTH